MPPDDPFTTTESYYAEYRPGYGDRSLQYLSERFDLAGERVLDLGCGAGQITVPLAAHAGTVVAMDPNETMLKEAGKRARSASRDNVERIVGSDADLRAGLAAEVGPIHLTTMGRAFHWMDQTATLDCLRDVTEPSGGVAILDDVEWLTGGRESWQEAVYEVAEEFVDDLPPHRDADGDEYETPWDELIEARGFDDVEVRTFTFQRGWDTDSVVGYVFSLSFCSPDTLGPEKEAFEAALRNRLHEFDTEQFEQTAETTVIAGTVK